MKQLVILLALSAMVQFAFAGGVVTNSNQSAQFIRSMARNASTEIDAVYYNPAGLANLADGWHFALYNQTIIQEKKVNNTFPL
ncbi:MAG: aromatic hydrocarbon degradation protein, partial [candidate division KSB1 bacterium]|nr:aromatic hydrocarbon degradation protein [candidate division KSB1 bacterium]